MYTYDALGQLTQDKSEGVTMDYDAYGLVKAVYQTSTGKRIVEYVYGDGGQRLAKFTYDENGTRTKENWYLGSIFEKVRTEPLAVTETPIPGGTLYRATGKYVYALTDHLGNVRAILERKSILQPGISFKYIADYYPYGWTQPGRADGSYRYGYQGQEWDEENKKWAFQLRQYDGRVGRWMTVDPKGQHHSPYLAMGNNPIVSIDPDGGQDGDPKEGNFFSRLFDYFGNFFKNLFSPNTYTKHETDRYSAPNGIQSASIEAQLPQVPRAPEVVLDNRTGAKVNSNGLTIEGGVETRFSLLPNEQLITVSIYGNAGGRVPILPELNNYEAIIDAFGNSRVSVFTEVGVGNTAYKDGLFYGDNYTATTQINEGNVSVYGKISVGGSNLLKPTRAAVGAQWNLVGIAPGVSQGRFQGTTTINSRVKIY